MSDTRLVEIALEDFSWLVPGGEAPQRGLRAAPGGVDKSPILSIIKNMTAALHGAGCRASWLILCGDEVVGLCSYRRPPANGYVEFGYGVAESRRGLGHATRAVALMLAYAAVDGLVSVVTAETSTNNIPSQRVLERNGFQRTGQTRLDPEDGEIIGWRKALASHGTIGA